MFIIVIINGDPQAIVEHDPLIKVSALPTVTTAAIRQTLNRGAL